MRLFIAIRLPVPALDALTGFIASLRSSPRRAALPLAWSRSSALHLTLQFLGEVPPDDLQAIMVACQGIQAPPACLCVDRLLFFPSANRARVVAAGLAGDVAAIVLLAQQINEKCAAAGYPPETRPFTPHITLARCRAGLLPAGGRLLEQAAAARLPLPAFQTASPWLMESRLNSSGAEHLPLQELGHPRLA